MDQHFILFVFLYPTQHMWFCGSCSCPLLTVVTLPFISCIRKSGLLWWFSSSSFSSSSSSSASSSSSPSSECVASSGASMFLIQYILSWSFCALHFSAFHVVHVFTNAHTHVIVWSVPRCQPVYRDENFCSHEISADIEHHFVVEQLYCPLHSYLSSSLPKSIP